MTARQIQLEVCALHCVAHVDVVGKCGRPEVVAARNEAMARCRVELRMSYPQIARLFTKNHSTVMHGIRKHLGAAGEMLSSPEPMDRALVRQARMIASQAQMLGEQARQIAALAEEVAELRIVAARVAGQRELFAVQRKAS